MIIMIVNGDDDVEEFQFRLITSYPCTRIEDHQSIAGPLN